MCFFDRDVRLPNLFLADDQVPSIFSKLGDRNSLSDPLQMALIIHEHEQDKYLLSVAMLRVQKKAAQTSDTKVWPFLSGFLKKGRRFLTACRRSSTFLQITSLSYNS